VVLEQAENRLHLQKGLMVEVLVERGARRDAGDQARAGVVLASHASP